MKLTRANKTGNLRVILPTEIGNALIGAGFLGTEFDAKLTDEGILLSPRPAPPVPGWLNGKEETTR